MSADSFTTETRGEGFAFFRWVIKWGFAYNSQLTNRAAIFCWIARGKP